MRIDDNRITSLHGCCFPLPVANFQHVLAVLVDVLLVLDQFVLELLLQVDALVADLRAGGRWRPLRDGSGIYGSAAIEAEAQRVLQRNIRNFGQMKQAGDDLTRQGARAIAGYAMHGREPRTCLDRVAT